MSNPPKKLFFSSSITRSCRKQSKQSSADPFVSNTSHTYKSSSVNECFGERHKTSFILNSKFKLETAQKWITFTGKHQVQFPLQTILPKVQMIRQVPPKQIPRDVEVERRRKTYAKVNIAELLQDAGISNMQLILPHEVSNSLSKDIFAREMLLPLYIFDDESFDSNSYIEWLNTGLIEGERHPLPAWALIKGIEGQYSWDIVAVYGFNDTTFQYTVIDLKESQTHQVHRIHLMFMAENPYNFLERIKHALHQRTLAEEKIRFETLLDCALFDETPPINKALLDRILEMSLIQEQNLAQDEPIVQSMKYEVQINYQRVMIAFEFGNFLQSHQFEFKAFKIPIILEDSKYLRHTYRLKNRMQFEQSRKSLRIKNLLYANESIQAMLKAASECTHIETLSLFSNALTKPLPLTEFVSKEENNSLNVVKYLKYTWPENLSSKICLCLRNIGKGWLDISVSDWSVFNVAKISKFFFQIKLRMQESLQILMEKSILNYSRLLNEPCFDFLDLKEDFTWDEDFRTSQFDRLHLPPVFMLILHINANGPFFSTDPSEFEPTVTKLLYSTLMSTCGIRIIERDSLINLNFAKNLYIFTVELVEELYIEHVKRLHSSYSKAVIPLNAYLQKYQCFVDFHELIVDDFIKEFTEAEKTSQEVKSEILWQKEQKEELRNILPEQIVIGPFQIIVEPLKKFLINKRIEIIRKLFLYYVDRMLKINEHLLEDLQQINEKLHEKLLSVEHLFEIKNYMTMVPDKLQVLRERIQIMMLEYNMLDSFLYNLSDQQFSMKWEAFAWPYKITKRLIAMKEEHKVEIEEFKRIQIRELATFQERLESLNEEIMAFSLQFDAEKALEVAVDVKKTWKTITDLQKLGTLLQERQTLFEADSLSLDYLSSIIESFNPYRAMWSACSDFIKLEEITIGNPLTSIDLNETRETLSQIKEVLEKSIEIFKEKEEVQNVAVIFLKKINQFNTTIEVMECIKNENWLMMHWQEFAQKSEVDIKFSLAMNFNYCIKKGILNHVEIVKEIAEKAILEADSIRLRIEEEKRLKLEAEMALLEKKMKRKCRTDIL